MTHKVKVIAIDGPSGSGKSTIAKMAAASLGLIYIDTGAMFRAIAYSLKDLKIDFEKETLTSEEEKLIFQTLSKMDFKYAPSEDVLIEINGEDLTTKIREHEVSRLASLTSRYPVVRDYLKKIQRKIGEESRSLLDGRDIGTIVFPDAPLKFFITASARVRAKRRYDQLVEFDAKNEKLYSISQIEQDIEERDAQDMNRATAPLKKATDAIVIDTSSLTIKEVLAIIEEAFFKKEQFFK